jgi:hypothetical protein
MLAAGGSKKVLLSADWRNTATLQRLVETSFALIYRNVFDYFF